MNQRFEDTLLKAVDAVSGMARDFRVLEERNRLLTLNMRGQEDNIAALLGQLGEARKKVTQCVKCEHPEYHEAKFTLIEPGRLIEHEESDIDLAIGKDGRSFTKDEWAKEQGFPFCGGPIPAPKAPRCYDRYFDVLMWRWVFNTVRL